MQEKQLIQSSLRSMMIRKERTRRGALVASVLKGVWRQSPQPVEIRLEELNEITPLLLSSGSGALAWRQIQNSDLRTAPPALQLQQTHRLQILQAAMREREIAQALGYLLSAGLQPLLAKGWAIGRLYPAAGLRPYGDVDLYLRPEEFPAASVTVMKPDCPWCPFDLHRGAPELKERSLDEIYARSLLVRLGPVQVRILGPEDHLRLLCLHTLGHGAWRPLWLCDIAVALESRPTDFDWDYFMKGNQRRSEWVVCALGLAHGLLGARVDDTPVASRAKALPQWLIPSVLRQWSVVQTPHGCRTAMQNYLRNPAGVLDALQKRWPNPIEATVGRGGPFNDMPRLPYQLGECFVRTARFALRLPALMRTR
jgi:hypothetical protein